MLGGTVKVGQLGIRHVTENDILENTVYPVGQSLLARL